MTCKEGYICPNNNLKCVSDLRDCIPPEIKCNNSEEYIEKPFKCNGTDECVDSMTKCVPNDNAVAACKYMNALFPIGKKYLCSNYLPLNCKLYYPNYKILCDDSICRKKTLQPSQRVCPIGKILCLDLICQDNLDKSYNDWPECGGNTQVRCPDQSCANDQKNCPTTITCPNPNHKVFLMELVLKMKFIVQQLKFVLKILHIYSLIILVQQSLKIVYILLLVAMENLYALT